jgi:predicted permease
MVSFLRTLLFRRRVERDMDLEWQFHLEARVASLLEDGLTRPEAERRAGLEFGDPLRWKEQSREARGLRCVQDLGADLRSAIHQVHRAPVVSGVVIGTLALAIGANTAIFSVVNSLLLRPLPVADPHGLVMLSSASRVSQGSDTASWPYPVWEEIRQHAPFDAALAWSDFSSGQRRFDLGSGGEAQPVDGLFVSGGFFDALGVRAVLGRTFTAADDEEAQREPVGVISYNLWRRRFGSAADAIGRSLFVDRIPVTVIGVLPPGFFGVEVGRSFDIALPFGSAPLIQRDPDWLGLSGNSNVSVMLRLAPRQSLERGTVSLRGMQARIAETAIPVSCMECRDRFLADSFTLVEAGAGISELRGQYRGPLLTVSIIAGLVLLIACANVANLMAARVGSRSDEMGVRLALGASRWRLARQMLAESLVLAAAGAAAGLLVAVWAGAWLAGQLATLDTRVVLDLPLDVRVVGFSVAATLVTTALFGTMPALRASRAAPAVALRGSTRDASAGRRDGRRFRLHAGDGGLIVQVALSLVLVVAAGLFLRSFERLLARPLGYDSDRLLVTSVNAARTRVDPADRAALFGRLAGTVEAVPGVARAAASLLTPVSGNSMRAALVDVPGVAPLAELERLALSNFVTPGWFDVYGARVLAGRDIDGRDTMDAPRVVVVNEAFVRRFFQDGDAVGRTVHFTTAPAGPRTIVGVVGDTILWHPAETSIPAAYEPLAQWGSDVPAEMRISIRSASEPPALLSRRIAAALSAAHADLSFSVHPLSDQVDASLARNRLLAWLSGAFGVLALLLAAVGLYGVTAYAALQRRREVGIRMAVGASRRRVVRLMLARVMRLVTAGIVIGIIASVLASRLVAGLLYGIDAGDPGTLLAGTLVLSLVGAAAAWLPAWRASRVDPWAVLRES